MPAKKGQRFGGRQKGTKNKSTVERENGHKEIVSKAAEAGLTPLEYMLRILRDETKNESERFAAAKEAAPYIHARLSSVTADVESKTTVTLSNEAADEVNRRISRIAERTGPDESTARH